MESWISLGNIIKITYPTYILQYFESNVEGEWENELEFEGYYND